MNLQFEPIPVEPTYRRVATALVDHEGADWKKLSVLDQVESLTNPVFLLIEPARSPAIDSSTTELRAKLRSLGRAPEHLELDPGFAAALPASRALVYRKIGEFLDLRLHDYAVKIGPTEEVK